MPNKNAIALIGAALTLSLTACGSSESSSDGGDKEDVWPSSGKALSSYKGSPTYKWRKNLLDHRQDVDIVIMNSALGYEKPVYDVLIDICKSAAKGAGEAKLTKVALAGLNTDQVSVGPKQAKDAVAVAQKQVCP